MSLLDHIQQFHFIRPDWLLLLLPAFALFLLLLKRKLTAGQWQDVIDEELLSYVLDNAPQKTDRSSLWLVMFAWVTATLALAGPSWEKMPTPVEKNQDALVILLDMSLSMGAQDVKPDRATRAIQKVTDIIRGRKDGLTALLTYSGEAHTVTPLTDDRDTIENLLPAISPFIMPKLGSRPDKAIALAQKLVTDAGINKARLLLITDGIINKDIQRINKVLDPKRFQLSVMTLGTAEGAPVSMPNSGFLRDGQGNIVLPKLDLQPIRKLVSELNVAWQPIRYDDQDWQQLLQPKTTNETQSEFSGGGDSKQFDQWFDQGFWLIFLLLPVTLLLFRRGVLFSWLLLPALVLPAMNPAPAWADDTASTDKQNAIQQQAAQQQTEQETSFWQNLWQTPDQQGAELLNSDPAAAAQRFENPDWQGVASYQAGDFEAAQRAFADNNSANGRYNYANALAQSGELQAALDAYDEALQQQPDFSDAAENRKLVEQALKQQQNQQQQNKNSQPQDSDQNQSGDSSQTQESQQQDSQQQNSQDSQQNQSQSGESQQQSQQSGDPSDQNNGEQGEPQNSSAVNKQQDDAFAEQKAAEQKAQQLAEQDQQQDKDGEQQALSEQSQDAQPQSEQQSPSATQQKNSSSEQQSDQSAADPTSMTQQQIQESQLNREEQAAMQQWLNRIPDNPGNLLQRKFLYQYRQQDGGQAEQQEDVLW